MVFSQKPLNTFLKSLLILLVFAFAFPLSAQSFIEHFRQENNARTSPLSKYVPLERAKDQQKNLRRGIRGEKQLLNLSPNFSGTILAQRGDKIAIDMPLNERDIIQLKLKQVDFIDNDFILRNAKGERLSTEGLAKFYWGYVEGYPASTVVFNVFRNEVSAFIDLGNETYTLAKIQKEKEYILYQEKDLEFQPELSCDTDALKQDIGSQMQESSERMPPNPDNCVGMYIEVDHDLYLAKGSNTSNTFNYVSGAFSQVAILYENENINFTIREMKIWDEVDPYTGIENDVGPSSGNFLTQFRSALLNTNWNGDLAHLVGNSGGGGVAYVGGLCNSSLGFGYSGIGNSYNNVPSYSWTVNVLTHEIGHNLGSPHTHACSWNGNNTQIDDCGNRYLANDNNPNTDPGPCYDANSETIPQDGGTIMSYCHLNSGGMNFNLGFGSQPGDLVRNNVYNASCLGPCEECTEEGNACDDGDPCTINDAINAFCECSGESTPDSDNDGICDSQDPAPDDLCDPNPCTNCTQTTLSITLDMYPSETSWQILNSSNEVVLSGANYSGSGSTVTVQMCLDDGCYDFIIYDSYGDGICCSWGNGSYSLTDANNNVMASGGEFGSSETTNFCYDNICTDVDQDEICDDVDPCYDPMVMDMGETLQSGTYNARSEIILNQGTTIPANAVIYLKSPSIKFMENTTIPANASVIISGQPCEE